MVESKIVTNILFNIFPHSTNLISLNMYIFFHISFVLTEYVLRSPMYNKLMHQFQHRIVVVREAQPVRDQLRVTLQARHNPRNHRRMSGGLAAGPGREAKTSCCWYWKQWSDEERCRHTPAPAADG